MDEAGFEIDTNITALQFQQRAKQGQLGITIGTIEVNSFPLVLVLELL
jgi:hypothetical protein